MNTYPLSKNKMVLCKFSRIVVVTLIGSLSAIAAAQAKVKETPAQLQPDIFILNESVVQEQWPASASRVNAPTDLVQVEPGQCIRFGVIATGDGRNELLRSLNFSFELTVGDSKQDFPAETDLTFKEIKPEGGDFVSQALSAAGIKSPGMSFASLAASSAGWCAPEDAHDAKAMVVTRATSRDRKALVLHTRHFEVKTFVTARKKPVFTDLESFSNWLQNYHQSPDPAHLLDGLRTVAHDPNLGSALQVMAFFVSALKANRAGQNDVAQNLPKEDGATRKYTIPLLKLAGYDIEYLANGMSTEDKARLSIQIPDGFDLKPDQQLPSRMDILWATFFATGRPDTVRTVASILAWREDYDNFMAMRKEGLRPTELTESIMRGVAYPTAGWSLSSMARNDGVVADYIEGLQASPSTSPAVKAELANLYTNPAFSKR